jgi:predicted acylesterase/phospholipase RssA
MRATIAEDKIGLVMTGGDARGAYQAGVLKRIGELKQVRTCGNPFPIIGAASAGAINGAALAAGSEDFAFAAQEPHISRTVGPECEGAALSGPA